MEHLLITAPVQAIAFTLFVFFCAIAVAARLLVLWRASTEGGKELAEEAVHLLTGLAATFAFFVGFAINVTWSGVSAGQAAVEQHAAALKQMSWSINAMQDRAESALLTEKLHAYAMAVANDDRADLASGDASDLPSDAALERFSEAVHAYAFKHSTAGPEVSSLLREAAAVSGTSAQVSAVAQRNPPRILVALLMVSGAIVAGVMGITTVASRFPALLVVWCLIPALSITVVIALIYPFARPIGVDLAPINTVAQQLVAR